MCKIPGHKKVMLRMKFRKESIINNMVHASTIQKSIVCGSLFSKNELKLVF